MLFRYFCLFIPDYPADSSINTYLAALLTTVLTASLLWPVPVTAHHQLSPHASKHSVKFAALEQAETFYLNLSQHHWPQLPAGKLLKPGQQHPRIAILRQQLYLLGDLPLAATYSNAPQSHSYEERLLNPLRFDPQYYDQRLAQALLQFQQRHGIKTDAILGPQSRKALNMSPAFRAEQLALNRQRQQDFYTTDKQRYIQVNIPEYRLRLFDAGEQILEMKTIIGRKSRRTPVFDSQIQALVLNPSWNVPRSIAYKDILPRWQEDPEYLTRKNLRVLSGWGNHADQVPADQVDISKMYQGEDFQRLWEPPGEGNTLGRIKFVSRSQYSVYLHDTSAPKLFDKHNRALSSGCIRLEQARTLADAILQLNNQADVSLDSYLQTSDTRTLSLNQPVDLHITYWTAWLADDGTLNFRTDLYKRDRREIKENHRQSNQQLASLNKLNNSKINTLQHHDENNH